MTAGGRVLDVTAVAPTLAEAAGPRPTKPRGRISWPGMQYRRDIGAAGRQNQRERSPRDPPLRPARDGRAVHRRGPVRHVARGRAPRRRGVGQARRGPAGRRRGDPRAGAVTSPPSRSGSASPTTTSPPSSTWCRSASAARPAAWVHYGLTSSDVVDTALSVTLVRACDLLIDAVDDLEARHRRPGAGVPRHADGRAHARHPRRAHDVRGEARAVGAAGAPRPRPPPPGPRHASRSASCRARRHLLQRRPDGGGVRLRAARARRRCRPPRCSPATVTPSSSTRAHRSARPSRRSPSRSATSSAPRCARSRSRSATGAQKGSSAMPHKRNPVTLRAALRAGARAAGQPPGRPRERRPLARARHLALVGRAHHPPRLVACSPTTCS